MEISTDNLAARLWRELTRAPHDKHHEWRTPVLATQGVDQMGPQARTEFLGMPMQRLVDCVSIAMRVLLNVQSLLHSLWLS